MILKMNESIVARYFETREGVGGQSSRPLDIDDNEQNKVEGDVHE